MNVEIERKFLVKSEAWRGLAEGVRFRQGYLQTHPCTVRVRTEGERGVLTIKGQTRGFSREEFEYEIDPQYMGGFRTSYGVEITNSLAVAFPIINQVVLDNIMECRDEKIRHKIDRRPRR